MEPCMRGKTFACPFTYDELYTLLPQMKRCPKDRFYEGGPPAVVSGVVDDTAKPSPDYDGSSPFPPDKLIPHIGYTLAELRFVEREILEQRRHYLDLRLFKRYPSLHDFYDDLSSRLTPRNIVDFNRVCEPPAVCAPKESLKSFLDRMAVGVRCLYSSERLREPAFLYEVVLPRILEFYAPHYRSVLESYLVESKLPPLDRESFICLQDLISFLKKTLEIQHIAARKKLMSTSQNRKRVNPRQGPSRNTYSQSHSPQLEANYNAFEEAEYPNTLNERPRQNFKRYRRNPN